MSKAKNTKSLVVKVVLFVLLGSLGIFYILKKPPTSEITTFRKSEDNMPQHYFGKTNTFSKLLSKENKQNVDGDAVSLTGKAGRYEESRIGKEE